MEIGRHLGQLQRELHCMQKREEDRDRRTELSLEAIEALIGAREEDSDRRFQEQAQENADRISKVRYDRYHRYKLHGTPPQVWLLGGGIYRGNVEPLHLPVEMSVSYMVSVYCCERLCDKSSNEIALSFDRRY